jgi:hypothetical protein
MRNLSPAHSILRHLILLMMHGEEYKLWNSSLCDLFYPAVTSSLLEPIFFLNTIFWNALSIYMSSHLHKYMSKIIILCVLIFMF